MPSIRIWTLESDYDAKAVKSLAGKLVAHLGLPNLTIHASGKGAVPRPKKSDKSSSITLSRAVRNYLKQDDCVIFVIDSDSPMSSEMRKLQQDSLLNQIERIKGDSGLAGKVFFAPAIQEVESWLLIDCLGIFCYFASKRPRFRENCREKVSTNQPFSRMVTRHQKGDTQNIVEAQVGGRGAKEFLIDFSEQILLGLNPNLSHRNIRRERYREKMSPDIARLVVVDRETLRRNNSLRQLGDLLALFN